jgi:hypothetical protein
MLGRLRMSVADAISAYEKLRPQSKMGFTEEFQASKFEEALKNIFKLETMKDVGSDACKTFVSYLGRLISQLICTAQLRVRHEWNEHERLHS